MIVDCWNCGRKARYIPQRLHTPSRDKLCLACRCDMAFASKQGTLPVGSYGDGTPIYAGDKEQQHGLA